MAESTAVMVVALIQTFQEVRMFKSGYAAYKRGKLYFNPQGWAILKELASKTHTSPTKLVIAALKRYIRSQNESK